MDHLLAGDEMQKTEIDRLSRAIIEAESALSSKSAELDSLRGEVDHLLAADEMQKTEIDRLSRAIMRRKAP